MGKHHAARYIADGVNVWVARLLLSIDGDKPFFVAGDFGVVETEIGAIRDTADRDEHALIQFFFFPAFGFAYYFDLLAAGGHIGHFCLHAHFFEMLLRVFQDRANEVNVSCGENGIESFDDCDFAAESGVNSSEFHADVTAADNQEVFRDVFNFESFGRSHHARVTEIKKPGQRWFRSHSDNRFFKLDELLSFGSFHSQGFGIFKNAAAGHDLDFAHTGEIFDSAAELFQNAVFPLPHSVHVDARVIESHSTESRLPRFEHYFRGMQKSFGWNAAAVQANATEARLLLDEDDFFAFVRCVKCRGITTRPRPDNHDLSLNCVHVLCLNLNVFFVEILKCIHEFDRETRCFSPIDHTMIV